MQGPLTRVSVVRYVGITQTSMGIRSVLAIYLSMHHVNLHSPVDARTFLDMPETRENTEDVIMLVDWRERKKDKKITRAEVLRSLVISAGTKTSHHRSPGEERRRQKKR